MKMTQLTATTIGLLATLAITSGCSKDGNKRNTLSPEVRAAQTPQKPTFSKPAVGNELTKDQVNQIKDIFNQKPAMELPPSELVLMDRDSKLNKTKLAELRAKEAELAAVASPETYALYKSLRANCRKDHFNMQSSATVPMEKVTEANDLRKDDHVLFDAGASYGATNCDVEAAGQAKYGAKVEKLETDGVVSADITYSVKALMKNPKYAQLLKSKGIIASTTMSALAAKQNINNLEDTSDISAEIKFNVNGSYFTDKNEIPVTSKYIVYGNTLSQTKTEVTMIVTANVKMPTFTATVVANIQGVASSDENSETQILTEKYYVNGHEKTRQQMQDLFGDNLKIENSLKLSKTLMN